MRKATVEDIKRIQLDILDVVDGFCKKNGINYYLSHGTLLGAIRHKGYIPWDDDIDIGMLRKDYEDFKERFNQQESNQYRFICPDNDSSFFEAFGKVVDLKTVLYEPDEEGIKTGINIDVFPFDDAPNSKKATTRQYDCRDFLRSIATKRFAKGRPRGSIIRVLIVYIRVILQVFPAAFLYKIINSNAQRYNHRNSAKVGDFTGVVLYRVLIDKDCFREFIEVPFENRKYRVPKRYDEVLKSYYGDYVKLPPKEKRISHHTYVAYVEE